MPVVWRFRLAHADGAASASAGGGGGGRASAAAARRAHWHAQQGT
jgi:hypothetical protein